MHEKLTSLLSCHTFSVYRIYYSGFPSFSYKVFPVFEVLFKISGQLKTLMKYIMTNIYISN